MRQPHPSKREAVLSALAEMLGTADRETERRARQHGKPRENYGVPWETLPRTMLDLSGKLCDHWNADQKIEVTRVLMKLATWAILSAESLTLWPLSDTDNLIADALILEQRKAGREA